MFNFSQITNSDGSKLSESDEVTLLIAQLQNILKPFMLRRCKKDVVKDLPLKKELSLGHSFYLFLFPLLFFPAKAILGRLLLSYRAIRTLLTLPVDLVRRYVLTAPLTARQKELTDAAVK